MATKEHERTPKGEYAGETDCQKYGGQKNECGDQDLCHIPVVILTTSAEESEILKMYKLRCSSYIIKPVDFEQFVRVIRSFTDYWLTVVVLPSAAKA